MPVIKDIVAREVLDSRADLTLEVDVILDNGKSGSAIIPSGVSVGKYEAIELRDKNPGRFDGKGVLKAIAALQKTIKPALVGRNPLDQAAIDKRLIDLDGTQNKSHLGANSILGVSMATAKASANHLGMSLCTYIGGKLGREMPLPILTMLCGGLHGGGNIDFQDFQIVPLAADTLKDALQIGKNVYTSLKNILVEQGMPVGVAGTGGFIPYLESNEAALKLLTDAIRRAGYQAGTDVGLSMDVASEMFYEDGEYRLKSEGKSLASKAFIDLLEEMVDRYPIVLIEDPMGEDDIEGWVEITKRLGHRVELVGDDVFTTNIKRFSVGIERKVANSILVKPNQIGTLTETLNIIATAKAAGYGVVISRRSGESEDASIADIAVATNCGKVKFGSFARTEGLSKYNQLLRLEEHLGSTSVFRGKKTLKSDLERLSGEHNEMALAG